MTTNDDTPPPAQAPADQRKMTVGEYRVRISFNPSSDSKVDDIKRRAADAIDWCESLKQGATSGETIRLCALAQTAFEEAAMWAVKAATTGK